MFYHYQIGSSSKGREAREEEPGPLLLTVVTAGVAVAGLGVGQGGAQDWADLQACSEGGQGEPLFTVHCLLPCRMRTQRCRTGLAKVDDTWVLYGAIFLCPFQRTGLAKVGWRVVQGYGHFLIIPSEKNGYLR